MKNRVATTAGLLASFFYSGLVLSIPFTDTVTCSDVSLCEKLYEGNTYTYYHDLGEFGVPGSNLVTDAEFEITFRDDGSASDHYWSFFGLFAIDWREEVGIDFDNGSGSWDVGGGGDIIDAGDTTPNMFSHTLDVNWLNDDGLLRIDLWVDNDIDWALFGGDYNADIYFIQSEITGNLSPVPEPAPLALLGLGLLGLASMIRKKS